MSAGIDYKLPLKRDAKGQPMYRVEALGHADVPMSQSRRVRFEVSGSDMADILHFVSRNQRVADARVVMIEVLYERGGGR